MMHGKHDEMYSKHDEDCEGRIVAMEVSVFVG